VKPNLPNILKYNSERKSWHILYYLEDRNENSKIRIVKKIRKFKDFGLTKYKTASYILPRILNNTPSRSLDPLKF
jgi:hypothetical protein